MSPVMPPVFALGHDGEPAVSVGTDGTLRIPNHCAVVAALIDFLVVVADVPEFGLRSVHVR